MALDDFRRDVSEVVLDPGDGGDTAGIAVIGGGIPFPAGKRVRVRGGEGGEGQELPRLGAFLGLAEAGYVV